MLTPIDNRAWSAAPRLPGPARRQRWAASSRDGIWAYQRAEDDGTRWYLIHLPTNWTIIGGHGTLRAARHDTATGEALLDLWLDAHRVLLKPDSADRYDQARSVLAWLSDHEPRIVQIASCRVEARLLRELAYRSRLVCADLDLRINTLLRAGSPEIEEGGPAGRLRALRAQYDDRARALQTRAADLIRSAADLCRIDLADRSEALHPR